MMANKTRSLVLTYLKRLKKFYPEAHCALHFRNPYELLIATILSAQCTDERVNIVTKVLFQNCPNPESVTNTPLEKIEELIRSTGFYKNKAKNIKNCCQTLVLKFNGKVPQTLDELIQLSGVGRKTANVVLGNAFGITSGIVVDTHVSRLAKRWGWTKNQDPEKIESDLEKIIPHKDWILISHLMIWHGRKICKARNPQCESCFLFDHCPRLGL